VARQLSEREIRVGMTSAEEVLSVLGRWGQQTSD
jgi:hypothetical protein